MQSGPASATLVFAGLAILTAGLWAWIVVAAKAAVTWRLVSEPLADPIARYLIRQGLFPRLPLIAWSPRRPVPWAFLDLIIVIGVYLLAGAALHESGLIPSGKIETLTLAQKHNVIAANVVLSLGVALASIGLTIARCGATGSDFGLSFRTIVADLRLGLIAFVMLAPPVYALQGILVQVWKKSEHPIVEMFKDTPSAAFFGLLFLSAAVVAPLFEELIFRVLLQGFLEKVVTFRGNPLELLVGPTKDSQPASAGSPSQTADSALPLPSLSTPQPILDRSHGDLHLAVPALSADEPELRGPLAWFPIAVSSAIFALLHYSHGPDWIPLLFLAAGMGYLYQRTHRLLPSLTVHALLNALSMWGLWVATKSEALGP